MEPAQSRPDYAQHSQERPDRPLRLPGPRRRGGPAAPSPRDLYPGLPRRPPNHSRPPPPREPSETPPSSLAATAPVQQNLRKATCPAPRAPGHKPHKGCERAEAGNQRCRGHRHSPEPEVTGRCRAGTCSSPSGVFALGVGGPSRLPSFLHGARGSTTSWASGTIPLSGPGHWALECTNPGRDGAPGCESSRISVRGVGAAPRARLLAPSSRRTGPERPHEQPS